MILMLAPAAGMVFGAAPSGGTYVADDHGLVFIANDLVADQTFLANSGCFTLTPFGGWGTYGFTLLSDLYSADAASNLVLPGITGFPLYTMASVLNDGGNIGTWAKTSSGVGSGHWTQVSTLTVSNLADAVAAAAASATLAGHYANDNVNSDVPGGPSGSRGAKYWNTQAAANAVAAAAAVSLNFATKALAYAGTTLGQTAIVPQAAGYAEDVFRRESGDLAFVRSDPTGPGFTVNARIANEIACGSLPADPIVKLNPRWAALVDGRYIPPSWPSAAPRNLYSGIQLAGPASGAVFTPFYTVIGGYAYHRVQLASHPELVELCALPSGVYAAQFYLRSTAGAGTQTITAGLESALQTKTTTEGADVLVTVPPTTVSGDSLWVYNHTDTFPVDVLVRDDIIVVSDYEAIPSSAPPTQGAAYPASTSALGGPGTITLNSRAASIVAPAALSIDIRDAGVEQTYTNFTMIVAFKQTGDTPNNSSAVNVPNGTGTDFYTATGGIAGNLPIGSALGLNWSGAASILGLGWSLVMVRWGPNARSILFEGALVLEDLTSATTAPSFSTLQYGGAGYMLTQPIAGEVGPLRVWNETLTDDEAISAFAEVRQQLILDGETVPERIWLLGGGDSNGAGAGGSTSYINLEGAAAFQSYWRNLSVPGTGIAYWIAQVPELLRIVKGIRAMGGKPIFSLMIGTNDDPLPTLDQWKQIWVPLRAAGCILIGETMWPYAGHSWTESDWLAYNQMIRDQVGVYYDVLSDAAATTVMGTPIFNNFACISNLTYYFSDAIHITQAGHNAYLPFYDAAVQIAVNMP